MKEKNKVGGLTVSDKKHKRQIGQWNRIKSSEIYSHKYGQMTFGKEAKAKQ